MITVVEFRGSDYNFTLHTAFSVSSLDTAKEHFSDALENSSNECQYPYIALTVYSDDGKAYIDSDVFTTIKSAIEWWEEKCSK